MAECSHFVSCEQENPQKHKLSCRYVKHHPMFYIKPVKEELMYFNPRIAIYHDLVTQEELSVVRRLARPRVRCL